MKMNLFNALMKGKENMSVVEADIFSEYMNALMQGQKLTGENLGLLYKFERVLIEELKVMHCGNLSSKQYRFNKDILNNMGRQYTELFCSK